MKTWIGAMVLVGCASLPGSASATFSIVACDAGGSCGAAVATHNLAVGATVIHAQARVGAIASQFETHPRHGTRGLALLALGRSAPAAIEVLLSEDGNFDGQDPQWRQLGVVGASGDGAAFTGRHAAASYWAGSTSGPGFSAQGNGLVGAEVTTAMRDAFMRTRGALPERLMAALEAGRDAGGQKIGTMSAALLVRTPQGNWNDVDLRVDAAPDPVPALRNLLNLRQAHSAVLFAERQQRNHKLPEARTAIAEAMRLGKDWDRIWRRIARLSMTMGDQELALRALASFARLNPAWASTEVRDDIYRPLALLPAFQSLSINSTDQH
ncbi:DUF1028 domain-containing protein [Roseateles sp.]|uniref:DUF1028 domain-containing protein n=1 Tax=Roseateles sp. TaxID=1971397 RepID=UPI0039E966B8